MVDGLPFCYNSGIFSYRVDALDTMTIELAGDVNELSVFFAAGGPSKGEMRFFDAAGGLVDSITTNGDCGLEMPAVQNVIFASPVRSMEVTAGLSNVYIDSFAVNP